MTTAQLGFLIFTIVWLPILILTWRFLVFDSLPVNCRPLVNVPTVLPGILWGPSTDHRGLT